MVKPKFTPDPPPNIDGLPVEDQIRMILDHVQRQYNRQEDWWPKDFEERVQTLEELSPYCIGTWPIVDYSTVVFNDEISDAACVPDSASFVDEGALTISPLTSLDFNSFDMDAGLNRAYFAQSSSTGNGQGITQYSLTSGDPSTLAYVAYDDLGTKASELFTGVPGNFNIDRDNGNKFIVTQGTTGGSTSWLRSYTMSTSWDITTASRTSSKSLDSDVALFAAYPPLSAVVTRDGKQIFVTNNNGGASRYLVIYQWTMSTAWDVSTATYTGSANLDGINPADTTGHIIRIWYVDDLGENIITSTDSNIYAVYNLSTANNITSTITLADTFTLGATSGIPSGKCLFVPQGCGTLHVLETVPVEKLQRYTIS